MSRSRVSVVGLGKLGSCIASVLAYKGAMVVGVDIDQAKVDAINAGRAPILEPKLQSLIRMAGSRLRATSDLVEAVRSTDATFVVVPTPSDSDGSFSLEFVRTAIEGIGRALRSKRSYHLISLTSTVVPGSMEQVVAPLIEASSGKKVGQDLGLCYSPELIALGDVINGLMSPELLIIGASDRKAAAALVRLRLRTCNNRPYLAQLNFVNAEIAKISLNSFVTMKMSFANTLAEICERLPGADVDEVTSTIGMDSRVGGRYLKGALGYGGPCFPRDNVAFVGLARKRGVEADLASATHEINLRQVSRILKKIESEFPPGTTVAVLGLAYKPGTSVVESSQAMALAIGLVRRGYRVRIFDPNLASIEIPEVLRSSAVLAKGIRKCLRGARLCVIATPWPVFKSIDEKLVLGMTVIDCWRILAPSTASKTDYLPVGRFVRRAGINSPLLRRESIESPTDCN